MADAQLTAQVTEVVRVTGKVSPTALVTAESRLVEDLGIDSLDLVAVFLQVQDRFDVLVDDADVPAPKTIGDLVAYVAVRRGAAAA